MKLDSDDLKGVARSFCAPGAADFAHLVSFLEESSRNSGLKIFNSEQIKALDHGDSVPEFAS